MRHKKSILRLPPYYSELNPIELVWSSVKNNAKLNNTTFKLSYVKNLLIEENADDVFTAVVSID